MAAESWWWPLSAWLSSGAAWFVFFNVIVGVVTILSWGQGGDATLSRRRRLTRSASSMVMERLRSVSIFSFRSAAEYGSITQSAAQLYHVQEYYTSQEEAAADIRPEKSMVVEPEQTVLVGESTAAAMAPPSAPVATAAVRAAATSTTGSEEAAKTETQEEMPVSLELDESCAVARRGQALALQPPPSAAVAAEAAAAAVERPRKREPTMVVEIVERRAYAEVEEKEEVNARAEQFIRQFREDLKLERLNSILNYSRCAGAAPAR